jgi:hypothetical protein
MDMSTAHTTHTMSGGSSMTGDAMQGMIPLVAGADGTRPAAAGLRLGSTSTRLVTGPTPWTFRITDTQGMAVTRFESTRPSCCT